MKAYRIRKNDTVGLIAGKDIGKEGRVLEVDREKGRVLVEGRNIVQRHSRATRQRQQAGIAEVPAYMDLSNVMLKCPHCGELTRVGKREDADKRKRVRFCKKCNENIDKVK
jgi:large subunit ribosomal protein L24